MFNNVTLFMPSISALPVIQLQLWGEMMMDCLENNGKFAITLEAGLMFSGNKSSAV